MSRNFDAVDEVGRSDPDALFHQAGFLYYVLLVQSMEVKRLEAVNQKLRDHASSQDKKLQDALKNAADIAGILEVRGSK
ncbi:MAG: hypothetical protein B7Y61_03105 [Rhizobiales bacterium 35-66-30]|nr:MAG: hypothetical protein B7Y61_03105 [Rhizobiales bacterium 35-66-30]